MSFLWPFSQQTEQEENKEAVKMYKSYKRQKTYEERLKESKQLLNKFQDKIPVIVERHPQSKLQNLKKTKYLIQKEFTLIQLNQIIRQNLNNQMEKTDALYIFQEDKLLMSHQEFEDMYNRYKDRDGFLYLRYCEYTSFGSI